ncbi:helix-turn-helix domain-containing protein [Vibrio kanaloae]|uniref:helix-turn-helix domain-containing protein n=1 Tax=Vibrio kanaloae TaxID=170673 RepID=UPI00148B7E74|nr:helix-turn-helix transcriptional regulator [Vibrio kanaloae]NOJ02107.1 helix-turn-helix domain-containing protein [Vibrio kanaloae]
MKLLEIIRKIRKLTNKQLVRLSDRKVLNASEIIEVACKSKGFTPKQIADLCGKTPSTISKWKSKVGESAGYLPTEVQLAPLADSIGIVMDLEPIPSVPKKLTAKKDSKPHLFHYPICFNRIHFVANNEYVS